MAENIFKNRLKQKRADIAWLAIVGFFLAVLIFSISICYAKIIKDSKKLALSNARILVSKQQSQELQNFQSEYQNYNPNLNKIDEFFIDAQNPLNFIEFIEKSASGLSIDIKISQVQTSKPKTLSVQMSAKGDFSDIINFVKTLETGPYLIFVQNLSIENSSDESPSGTVVSNIFLSAITK